MTRTGRPSSAEHAPEGDRYDAESLSWAVEGAQAPRHRRGRMCPVHRVHRLASRRCRCEEALRLRRCCESSATPSIVNGIPTGQREDRCHCSRYTLSQGLSTPPYYCPTMYLACAAVCALVAAAYLPPAATAGVASASAEARESSRYPAPPRPRGGRIWAPDRCWASPERRLGLPGRWTRE